jgi:DNA-binding cell septation regulator SpoVG
MANITSSPPAVESADRPKPAIQVLELRRVENLGSIRAFVKLRLGGLIVHGVKVIRQEGQAAWIALPQQPARPSADGGKGRGWSPILEATPELMAKIKAVVLAAWEAQQQPAPVTKATRDQRVNELARRFDERGPDSPEDIL